MNQQLWNALLRHQHEQGAQVALADASNTILYRDLPRYIEGYCRQLQSMHTQVLAIDLDNGAEWIAWDLAAMQADVVCVPIPPFFSESQRQHVLQTAGVDTLVSADGIVRLNVTPADLPPGTGKITFTSGSTGEPKGVCLDWQGMQVVATSVLGRLDAGRCQRHLCVLPLAILLENVAGVYTALMAGARIDFMTQGNWMDPAALLSNLLMTQANTVILMPEMVKGLMAAINQSGQHPDALEFIAVGGSPVSAGLIENANCMGLPVYEGYGLSECGSVVCLNSPGAHSKDTAGQVLPHVELMVRDGELVVTNPLFLGYLGDSDQRHLHHFNTGDLGEVSKDGYVKVSGRRKNLVITSYGRNISPEWLESELLSNPVIAQVVVCGDGWPNPAALIVARESVSDQEIDSTIEQTNLKLPDYARISAWLRVPPFTHANGQLTGNGRPRRQGILDIHLQTLEQQMKQHDFYKRLDKSTQDARDELYTVPQLRAGLSGNISLETYIAYLTEAYHHVRHTVPFLMAMGSRLPREKQWLQSAIVEYIREECGHEEWILNDIKAAGGDADAVRNSTPRLATQVLVSYNYDYIHRKNPVGFLGMVFMLESTSIQLAENGASSIQQALQLPETAFSYLFSHGALDQEHMKFYQQLVNRITDTEDQDAIIEVANNTFRLFADVLRSIPYNEELKNVA